MSHRSLTLFVTAILLTVQSSRVHCSEPPSPSKATQASEQDHDEYYELLKVFVDTLDQVERNYVKDLSRRELLEAAIEGMVSRLDQYSNYIAPEELDRFRANVESQFGGIGIQYSKGQGSYLNVISPLVGSPAYRAGLRAGDMITHIEGVETKDLRRTRVEKLIKGAVGTSVELTVRQGQESPRTMKLTREIVRVETVMGDRRNEDDSWKYMYDQEARIAYIRVTAFAKHTVGELRKVVQKLKDEQMRALILDLRFNPGGLLSSAIQISDLFVSEGRIVSTEGRNTQPRVWDAHPRGTFDAFPMAVLVNGSSASASEIVAACLQDHQRAVVVGERTFGKGSVQNIIALENGRSALKLTTAGYKRPSGKNIHRFPGTPESGEWGVRPDEGLDVDVDDLERDQLEDLRHRRDIVTRGTKPSPEESETKVVDSVLEKALSFIRAELAKEHTADESEPSRHDKD